MLAEMAEALKKVRQNLRVAQDRQKVYAEKKRTYREFQSGDHVYLKVKPEKSSLQWRGCAKLVPWYCGPFQVLERVRSVAYRLALRSHIWVLDVFHVSLLMKYVYNPQHIIDWENIQVNNLMGIRLNILSFFYRSNWDSFLWCRSNWKESSWQNLSVFSISRKPTCRSDPSPRLKYNGSTMDQKRPLGKRRNLCRKLIQHCFMKVERTRGTMFLMLGGDVTPQVA